MHQSWDHIRTFHAVAQHGSLLAAARHLGLTQPTAGRHIDLLEDRLGFPLFTRGREGMRLTAKGADLVATAAEMLGSATQFDRVATGLEDRIAGPVRLTANEVFGALLLPGLLAGFMAEHPDIEIEVEVSNSASNLLARDADIAIRMFRPTQNDLIARKLQDLPMGLYAHEAYVARHGTPETLQDLRQHVLVGQDRNPSLIEALDAAGLPLSPADFAFRSDSIIASISAIRAGVGIGPLHDGMAAHWSGLVRVLPDLPIPPLEVWLACHADVRHSRRIRMVMDALADAMRAPYGAWGA